MYMDIGNTISYKFIAANTGTVVVEYSETHISPPSPLYTERSKQISLTSKCKRRYVENAIATYSTLGCFIRNFNIKQLRKYKWKYSYNNLGCLSFSE